MRNSETTSTAGAGSGSTPASDETPNSLSDDLKGYSNTLHATFLDRTGWVPKPPLDEKAYNEWVGTVWQPSREPTSSGTSRAAETLSSDLLSVIPRGRARSGEAQNRPGLKRPISVNKQGADDSVGTFASQVHDDDPLYPSASLDEQGKPVFYSREKKYTPVPEIKDNWHQAMVDKKGDAVEELVEAAVELPVVPEIQP